MPLTPGLEQALSRSAQGLLEERRPDGTVLLNLQGRFQSVAVAKITPEGELDVDCGLTPETAGSETKTEARREEM